MAERKNDLSQKNQRRLTLEPITVPSKVGGFVKCVRNTPPVVTGSGKLSTENTIDSLDNISERIWNTPNKKKL